MWKTELALSIGCHCKSPFAIGAKFAVPNHPVTLICDRDSLFRNLHALRTAIDFDIKIRIVCIESEEAIELSSVESILRDFGIPVSRFSQKEKLKASPEAQLESCYTIANHLP